MALPLRADVERAPTQSSANSQQTAAAAAARLTHLIYAAVLDEYMAEGLEDYRPDFLLHQRYLRTFIYEWGLLLDKRMATSSNQAWEQIAKRPSYLGVNFRVWQRTFPTEFGIEKIGDRISIGYLRETFLAGVLQSEDISDSSARSKRILELIEGHLLTVSQDQPLGLKIVDAFQMHEDPAIRAKAASIIAGFPRYANALFALKFGRDLALGLIAGPGLVANATTRVAGAASDLARETAAAALKFKNAIRFPEITAKWSKVTTMQKALGASAVGHGGVIVYPRDKGDNKSASNTTDSNSPALAVYAGAPPSTGLLVALALNTASEQSERLIEQRDFAAPQTSQLETTKSEWISTAKSKLAGWNSTGTIDGLGDLLIDGERLKGYWPADVTLARTTLKSRFQRMKKRIVDGKIADIEEFRRDVITNELEDYRGQRRTLTAVLLDWGGNCVAQTLTLLSLLTEFPQLISARSKLGFFLSPTHMEAVVITDGKAKFLVSGEIRRLDASITVLKPQALLVMALEQMGERAAGSIDDYYLSGDPEKSAGAGSSGLSGKVEQFIAQLGRLDFEKGISSSSIFSVAGKSGAADAPDRAKTSYLAASESESKGESVEGSFFDSLLNIRVSGRGSRDSSYVTIRPVRVATPTGMREICLYNLEGLITQYCRFSQYTRSGFTQTGLPTLNTDSVAYEYLAVDSSQDSRLRRISADIIHTSSKHFEVLRRLPPDFWYLTMNKWHLENIADALEIQSITAVTVQHAHGLEFDSNDREALLSYSFENTSRFQRMVGDSNSKWSAFLESISAPPAFTNSYSPSVRTDLLALAEASRVLRKTMLESLNGNAERKAQLQLLLKNDPLEKIQRWLSIRDSIVSMANLRPEQFVLAYAKLDPEIRRLVMRVFSENVVLHEYSGLHRYLDKLRGQDFKLVPEEMIAQTGSCSALAVKLPLCSSPEGCKAFKQFTNPTACASGLTSDSRQTRAGPNTGKESVTPAVQKSKRISLSPQVLAELSFFSYGGFQLWNGEVFAAAEKSTPIWFEIGWKPRFLMNKFVPISDPTSYTRNFEGLSLYWYWQYERWLTLKDRCGAARAMGYECR